jgi:hypothetical protein
MIPDKPSDAEIMAMAMKEFAESFSHKFTEGGKKYVNPIFDKDCSREGLMELIDAWAYGIVVREHRKRTWILIQALINAPDVEEETTILTELSEMYRPRELAVKITE